jgi:hypothetical protein
MALPYCDVRTATMVRWRRPGLGEARGILSIRCASRLSLIGREGAAVTGIERAGTLGLGLPVTGACPTSTSTQAPSALRPLSGPPSSTVATLIKQVGRSRARLFRAVIRPPALLPITDPICPPAPQAVKPEHQIPTRSAADQVLARAPARTRRSAAVTATDQQRELLQRRMYLKHPAAPLDE